MRILLEPTQKELLSKLVEASKSIPEEDRKPFFAFRAMAKTFYEITNPCLPQWKVSAYMGDYDELIKVDFIRAGESIFEVSPAGYEYYRQLNQPQIKTLLELTDEELKDRFNESARNEIFSYENYYLEIQRRSQEHNTNWMRYLTWAIVALTGLQVLIGLLTIFKSPN